MNYQMTSARILCENTFSKFIFVTIDTCRRKVALSSNSTSDCSGGGDCCGWEWDSDELGLFTV